jgi:uncharacterized membrane protein
MAENDDTRGLAEIRIGDFIRDMGTDLKLIVAFTLVTVAFIYVPVLNETILRSALGLAMILFVPGYALIAALFPGKADIDGIERAALSFGLSIAVVPLIGLGLNFTPWGIRLDPIVVCLTIFTLICAAAATVRRHSVPKEDRFSIDFKGTYKEVKADVFEDKTTMDKALTVVLILSILLSVAMVAYVIAVPKQGEKFTEFYILGLGGKADNYPTNFHLGDSKPVIVGITNHEYRNVTYDLVIALNDSMSKSMLYTESVTIADNQTLEKRINLTPDRKGTSMKMEFLLYADGNMTAPYRECHLWVNVTAT